VTAITLSGPVLGCLLALAAVAWIRRRFVVVTVVGTSMEPTFEPGDRVLARRAAPDRLAVGDVVVVTAPSDPAGPVHAGGPVWLIKRAAAVPGDPIPRDRVPLLAGVAETTVPDDRLVLLGDSPTSIDSRQIGYFDAERLVGVAVRRLRRRQPRPVK
jgi:signal peptidase I